MNPSLTNSEKMVLGQLILELGHCVDSFNKTQSLNVDHLWHQLNEMNSRDKGRVFEHFLAELFRGNGYIVEVVGRRGDQGADLIVWHPNQLKTPFFIVQAKNHREPLSRKEVLAELIQFETEASLTYQCKHYMLISLNGFVKGCEALEKTNLKMKDQHYLTSLIQTYQSNSVHQLPRLELYAHNERAYRELTQKLTKHQRAAVVQATGTGKSFIISQLLLDYHHQSVLVLAPSRHILAEIQKHGYASDQVEFLTYQKLRKMMGTSELAALQPQLIILDEFHRIGAEKWQKAIERLMLNCPEAKVAGFSATPVRFFDSGRDMTLEFFNGVQTSPLSLAQAVAERILPMPQYISALYTLDEELEHYRQKIETSSYSEIEKKSLTQQLLKQSEDWERIKGVPQLFKKHLPQTSDALKFIVFCENIQHLHEVQGSVFSWFKKAYPTKRFFLHAVYSGCAQERTELELFESQNSSQSVSLLFCVNKLNEGVHLKGVRGVVFLRNTSSPTIYYQQLGRALTTGAEQPLVFDLVNNFDKLKDVQFTQQLKESFLTEQRYRKKIGLPYEPPQLTIYDYLHECRNLFQQLDVKLKVTWGTYYQHLKEFKLKQGHLNVPLTYVEPSSGLKIGIWIASQRTLQQKGRLSKEREELLNAIGFRWRDAASRSSWDQRFEELVSYRNQTGHCLLSVHDKTHSQLAIWILNQRRDYKLGRMDPDKIEKLNQIGFVWELRAVKTRVQHDWTTYLKTYQAFTAFYQHGLVPTHWVSEAGVPLGRWCLNMRQARRQGKLDEAKLADLEQIQFIWDCDEFAWQLRLKELQRYYLEHGHVNVLKSETGICYLLGDQLKIGLGSWVFKQRSLYHQNQLEPKKLEQLNQLNFDWDYEEKWGIRLAAWQRATYSGEWDSSTKNWGRNQLMAYRRQQLSPYRIQKLKESGFKFA